MIRCNMWGNLGRDGELKETPSGAQLLSLNVASTEKWKSKEGQPMERTTWCKIDIWGKLAAAIAPRCKKGAQVFINGVKYQYDEKEKGEEIIRYHYFESTFGTDIMIVDAKRTAGSPNETKSQEPSNPDYGHESQPDPVDLAEDVPF